MDFFNTTFMRVPSDIWVCKRYVPVPGFRTLPEKGLDQVERNVVLLNVQELHKHGVSIISGTASSVGMNPGVEW